MQANSPIKDNEKASSRSNESNERHEKRLEAGLSSDDQSQSDSNVGKEEVIIVDWEGPHDSENPKNWSLKKKWASVIVVSSYTFITPVASSMIAPAVSQVGEEFGISKPVILSMITSIYVLAYGLGPLVIAPWSEVFGRAPVLQIANLFFFVFNLACGFSRNTGQLLAFRFLAGFGGSAPLAVGGAVMGDCFTPERRGQAVAIYTLAPLLGPVVGPIAGAWIAQKSNWRWVFHSTSILSGVVQASGFIFLRETFPPKLLEARAKRIRLEMGLDHNDQSRVKTIYDSKDRHWKQILKKTVTRPFVLAYYEPILQLLGVYSAFLYGTFVYFIAISLVSLPEVFQGRYHESVGIAGLNYIPLGMGLTGVSQINARVLDRIYGYFKAKNGGVGQPEFRLPPMFVAAIFLPLGLLLYGWTAQARIFWLVPDIGIFFLGAGIVLIFQTTQLYLIDTFTLYAASALATVTFLRALAGFGFPLFAPAMYKALGYGVGNSIIAAAAIAIGGPAPFIFWFYGERIRKRSKHAKKP